MRDFCRGSNKLLNRHKKHWQTRYLTANSCQGRGNKKEQIHYQKSDVIDPLMPQQHFTTRPDSWHCNTDKVRESQASGIVFV